MATPLALTQFVLGFAGIFPSEKGSQHSKIGGGGGFKTRWRGNTPYRSIFNTAGSFGAHTLPCSFCVFDSQRVVIDVFGLLRPSAPACRSCALFPGQIFALGNLQKCVGGFLLYKFWRIFPGILLEEFLGTYSHKNEEKKSGEKIREKIRRDKHKNPRKIRSAKNRP